MVISVNGILAYVGHNGNLYEIVGFRDGKIYLIKL